MPARRFKHIISLEERSKERAAQLVIEAQNQPPGYMRDRLLLRARQAGVVSDMKELLMSQPRPQGKVKFP